jgi:hypothetical protein
MAISLRGRVSAKNGTGTVCTTFHDDLQMMPWGIFGKFWKFWYHPRDAPNPNSDDFEPSLHDTTKCEAVAP